MFENNKGSANLVIIIISVVVSVLIFAAIIGFIIWKVMDKGDSTRESRRDSAEEEMDCGTIKIFLEDFVGFDDINFERDSALVCMGENIKKSCKDSKAIVDIDDISLTYRISSTRESNCKARLEFYSLMEEKTLYIECPISELVSYAESEWLDEMRSMIYGSAGGYAALMFVTTNYIGDDLDRVRSVGCTSNIYE